MMAARSPTIRLGLSRMERLYDASAQSWNALHVAGTNGKGSICAYIAGLCSAADIPHGRFTSPFLHHPSDSIMINGKAISMTEYKEHEKYVQLLPGYKVDPPTPFEMMTLIAFRAFEQNNITHGIVETGMGGRLDSTNVMRKKSVNVFSKIGMDHNQFLGSNILAIAAEKAGIITTPDTPCVLDDTSEYLVLDVIAQKAVEMHAPFYLVSEDTALSNVLKRECPKYGFAPHEVTNVACAIEAFAKAFPTSFSLDMVPALLPKLANIRMPGRLEKLDISHRVPQRTAEILLDGAHNMIGMHALSTHVGHNVRQENGPVTWVVGLSSPRDEEAIELIRALVQDEDTIVFTEYGAQATDVERETRPAPIDAASLKSRCEKRILPAERLFAEKDLRKAVKKACDLAQNGPLVVTGSLYLGSEMLRWVKP